MVTERTLATAKDLYLERGMSLIQVRDELRVTLGVSHGVNTIRGALRAAGVQLRRPGRRGASD